MLSVGRRHFLHCLRLYLILRARCRSLIYCATRQPAIQTHEHTNKRPRKKNIDKLSTHHYLEGPETAFFLLLSSFQLRHREFRARCSYRYCILCLFYDGSPWETSRQHFWQIALCVDTLPSMTFCITSSPPPPTENRRFSYLFVCDRHEGF